MKRILSFILTFLLLTGALSLTACGTVDPARYTDKPFDGVALPDRIVLAAAVNESTVYDTEDRELIASFTEMLSSARYLKVDVSETEGKSTLDRAFCFYQKEGETLSPTLSLTVYEGGSLILVEKGEESAAYRVLDMDTALCERVSESARS